MHRKVHEVWSVLSLEKCRKLLPDGVVVSDAELEKIREALYAVAEMVVNGIMSGTSSGHGHGESAVVMDSQGQVGEEGGDAVH